jgi:hypothetical protein
MIIYCLKNINGMALWPFILLRPGASERTINHERIHLRQQVELLVLPFYILYILSYVFNLFKYGFHEPAYRNIVFEKEAFQNDTNFNYLRKRKPFAWLLLI